QSSRDRVGACDGYLLADDRSHTCLEGIPGAGWTQPWSCLQERGDNLLFAEAFGRMLQIEVEAGYAPGTVDDVDDLLPVRQVGSEQKLALAARQQLEHARIGSDDDRPSIGGALDLFDAGDRASGEVGEHRLPIERPAERET